MAALDRCSSCRGFVPAAVSICPHCGASRGSSRIGTWFKAVGAGAVSVTMMACYGVPPDEPLPDDTGSTGSDATDTSEQTEGTTAPGSSGGEGQESSSSAETTEGEDVGDSSTGGSSSGGGAVEPAVAR